MCAVHCFFVCWWMLLGALFVVFVLSPLSICFTVSMLCHIVLFKLLSCLSCVVSVAFVCVGAIFCETGHGRGLYCFLLCTSVVV